MCPDGKDSRLSTTRPESLGQFDLEGREWRVAKEILTRLYGASEGAGFELILSEVAHRVACARSQRPNDLRDLDEKRPVDSKWFARPGRPAYCAYIDRFGGTLNGCASRIPYLRDLNVGLFHPLPLLKCRDGDSDGGFAVSDYRDVDPKLGTFKDLVDLASELRKADISLVLDVVCNHTAKEHAWAQGFVSGDPHYKDFYVVLKSEEEVEEWSQSLNQVFPDTAPGNFTFDEEAGGWVWTTFYPFQWDLNYANPRVFIEMLDVLFFLANAGAEGFRLDSATYLWKAKGTACRNLPQVHDILLAMKTLMSLVAPSVFFLAEAIEDIEEVIPFFGGSAGSLECDLAYNNTPMTALWGSLAEGTSYMFSNAIAKSSLRPEFACWLNYARCHDDIIWPAVNSLAPASRQKKWSDFYAGETGSFARGMAFQAPAGAAPSTCGMTASLCGVKESAAGVERLKAIYSVIFALDGIPMIYMGDEIGLTNDYEFLADPDRARELRWLNRPAMDWTKVEQREVMGTVENTIFQHFCKLNQLLRANPSINDSGPAESFAAVPEVLAFTRSMHGGQFMCTANLSDLPQTFSLPGKAKNLFTNRVDQTEIELQPWQATWLLVEI